MTISAKLAAKIEQFDAAYAEWMTSRADLMIRHEDESDEATNARCQRRYAAERALIATPAPHQEAIWQKWELLEHLLSEDRELGPRFHPTAIVAAAAIKADMMALA